MVRAMVYVCYLLFHQPIIILVVAYEGLGLQVSDPESKEVVYLREKTCTCHTNKTSPWPLFLIYF